MTIDTRDTRLRVLVTGANGFVGGWFVEAIHLEGWAHVRAGLSRWSGAARIARFQVELCLCDVMDQASLDAALDRVDVVIHCARGRADDSPVTTEGTRLLLERARAAGVRKVIFMSSVAVYGDAQGVVSETTLPVGNLTAYGRCKREAEAICQSLADLQMQVVVLRPTMIYGPFSTQWTLPYLQRLQSGGWKHLGTRGEGKCNLVYVGDLVRLVRHLVMSDTGDYSVFNANGPDVPTWNSYLDRFNALLGLPELQAAPNSRLGLQAKLRRPVRRIGKYMLAHHRPLLVQLTQRSPAIRRMLRRTEEDLRLKPKDDELTRFSADVTYAMDAAKRIGFVPPTDSQRGLEVTVAWARETGLAT